MECPSRRARPSASVKKTHAPRAYLATENPFAYIQRNHSDQKRLRKIKNRYGVRPCIKNAYASKTQKSIHRLRATIATRRAAQSPTVRNGSFNGAVSPSLSICAGAEASFPSFSDKSCVARNV